MEEASNAITEFGWPRIRPTHEPPTNRERKLGSNPVVRTEGCSMPNIQHSYLSEYPYPIDHNRSDPVRVESNRCKLSARRSPHLGTGHQPQGRPSPPARHVKSPIPPRSDHNSSDFFENRINMQTDSKDERRSAANPILIPFPPSRISSEPYRLPRGGRENTQ